jgi:hypothetical protein
MFRSTVATLLSLCLALVLSTGVNAQTRSPARPPTPKPSPTPEPSPTPPTLAPLPLMLSMRALGGLSQWTLRFQFNNKQQTDARENALQRYRDARLPEVELKYRPNVEKFFPSAPKILGETYPEFLITRGSPVLFGQGDNGVCVFVPGIAVGTILNTLRADERARAWRMASTIGLPLLSTLANAFEQSDVDCVGVGVTYGTKVFGSSEDDVLNLRPEFVAIFASKSQALAFSRTQLAEEDLLEKADGYVLTRDVTDLKKIHFRLPR